MVIGTKKQRSMGMFLAGVLAGLIGAVVLGKVEAWRRDLNQMNRDLYNLVAPIYDWWAGSKGFLIIVRQQLVEMLDLQPGDKVLEVSVGTGSNLPFIAEKIGPEGQIYGLDISEGMLARARKKIGELPCRVDLRVGEAEDLPYPSDMFDAVLHLGGINFFADRKKALEEMERVAKPGAKIVVSDETMAPRSGFWALLGPMILTLFPRLRPPLDLVPVPHPELHYLLDGYMYAIEWRKE